MHLLGTVFSGGLIYVCIVSIWGCRSVCVGLSENFLLLIYPICCLVVFNLGMGLILSAWFMMFKDIKYLYDIFTMMLMYFSAIFYTTDGYSPLVQKLFHLNPIRYIVIHGPQKMNHNNFFVLLFCLFHHLKVGVCGFKCDFITVRWMSGTNIKMYKIL